MRIALSTHRSAGDQREGAALLVIDRNATMPGRGAYLCRAADPGAPERACLERATRRSALARALRAPGADASKLVESVGS